MAFRVNVLSASERYVWAALFVDDGGWKSIAFRLCFGREWFEEAFGVENAVPDARFEFNIGSIFDVAGPQGARVGAYAKGSPGILLPGTGRKERAQN